MKFSNESVKTSSTCLKLEWRWVEKSGMLPSLVWRVIWSGMKRFRTLTVASTNNVAGAYKCVTSVKQGMKECLGKMPVIFHAGENHTYKTRPWVVPPIILKIPFEPNDGSGKPEMILRRDLFHCTKVGLLRDYIGSTILFLVALGYFREIWPWNQELPWCFAWPGRTSISTCTAKRWVLNQDYAHLLNLSWMWKSPLIMGGSVQKDLIVLFYANGCWYCHEVSWTIRLIKITLKSWNVSMQQPNVLPLGSTSFTVMDCGFHGTVQWLPIRNSMNFSNTTMLWPMTAFLNTNLQATVWNPSFIWSPTPSMRLQWCWTSRGVTLCSTLWSTLVKWMKM